MNYTPEQQRFIDARILQTKREILRGVILGIVARRNHERLPLTVHSFSELHDYCNANELGGLGDGKTALIADKLFGFGDRGNSQEAHHAWLGVCNVIQDAVDAWLQTRAMVDDAAFISKLLLGEQAQCLLDDSRAIEAFGMIMDMESRVGPSYGFTQEAVVRLRSLMPEPDHVLLGGNWYALDGATLMAGPVMDGTSAFDAGYRVDFDRLDGDSLAQAEAAHTQLVARRL